MSHKSFVVALADLERGPRSVTWPLTRDWLSHTFEDTDATPLEEGTLEVTLTKSGQDVLVRGHASARVSMPDARTLEPVELAVAPEVFLMLSPASPPEPARRTAKSKPKKGGGEAAPARGKRRGGGWSGDPELEERDAAADTYSGEEVVLDQFVREFLLLELPMVVHKDLRSAPPPAIAPLPAAPAEQPERVDPRLAPLAAIADRLRERKS